MSEKINERENTSRNFKQQYPVLLHLPMNGPIDTFTGVLVDRTVHHYQSLKLKSLSVTVLTDGRISGDGSADRTGHLQWPGHSRTRLGSRRPTAGPSRSGSSSDGGSAAAAAGPLCPPRTGSAGTAPSATWTVLSNFVLGGYLFIDAV